MELPSFGLSVANCSDRVIQSFEELDRNSGHRGQNDELTNSNDHADPFSRRYGIVDVHQVSKGEPDATCERTQ